MLPALEIVKEYDLTLYLVQLLESPIQPREALNKTGVVSWYETTGEL